MVDKYLASEMLEFNALSQFSIALFIYHGEWPCDFSQGQHSRPRLQTQPRPRPWLDNPKKFGLKANAKAED